MKQQYLLDGKWEVLLGMSKLSSRRGVLRAGLLPAVSTESFFELLPFVRVPKDILIWWYKAVGIPFSVALRFILTKGIRFSISGRRAKCKGLNESVRYSPVKSYSYFVTHS